MNDKMMHMLGIATKAGKLALGTEAAKESIVKHKCALVVMASDLSERTVRHFALSAEKSGIKTLKVDVTMEGMAKSVGKKTGVIAVNDMGFANRLLALSAQD
jgi:ribosomal protein L7Ae-like RNA K-turn-binding protein